MTIRKLYREDALARLSEFVTLLRDSSSTAIPSDFLLPFDETLAIAFWKSVLSELPFDDNDQIDRGYS